MFRFVDYSGILEALQLYTSKWKTYKNQKSKTTIPLSPHVFGATFHSIWSAFQSNRSASKFSTLRPVANEFVLWNENEDEDDDNEEETTSIRTTDIHKKVKYMEFQLNVPHNKMFAMP